MNLTAEQSQIVDALVSWVQDPYGDIREFALTGAAGTGKTSLLRHLKNQLDLVTWTAMTGKAARRLAQVVDVPAQTLHSLLYYPPKEQRNNLDFSATRPAPGGIVVIDEASMVTPKLLEDLQNTWVQEGTRILYVGDGYQLPPILSKAEEKKYGKDFTIFREIDGFELTQVMRSDDDVLYAATYLREEGKLLTESRGAYEFRQAPICMSAINDWFDDRDDHALITWRNKLRMDANTIVRTRLGHVSPLPERGEPVLFRKNGQGVLNGQIEPVESIVGGVQLGSVETHDLYLEQVSDNDRPAEESVETVRVTAQGRDSVMDGAMPWLENDAWRAFTRALNADRDRLRAEHDDRSINAVYPIPITWGYVLTGHVVQGSEYRRATIFLTSRDTNSRPFRQQTKLPNGKTMSFALRWMYSALTRAREQATIVVGG